MRIAILGIRGIPAKYGGFETLAEQLAPRLVERGHEVTVYGRSNIITDYKSGNIYKGVRLIILPTISHKYLDTPVHTIISVFHTLFEPYDAILICNAANSIFSFIPRLRGQKVAVNVDGIERKRQKWNMIGKAWYLLGEFLSCYFPDRIITDAEAIREYYQKRYKTDSTMIPYGYNSDWVGSQNSLYKLGLVKNEYLLCVGRLEPENNMHLIMEAFKQINTKKQLIVVGDAPYASEYKRTVQKLAEEDKRIVLAGYIFGDGYKELQSNAYCYIHAGEVGGTPPALVEAMGYGNCIIVNGTKENREVIDNTGLVYEFNNVKELKEKIEYVLVNPDERNRLSGITKERARTNYSWESVTDKYESLFKEMLINLKTGFLGKLPGIYIKK